MEEPTGLTNFGWSFPAYSRSQEERSRPSIQLFGQMAQPIGLFLLGSSKPVELIGSIIISRSMQSTGSRAEVSSQTTFTWTWMAICGWKAETSATPDHL